MRSSREVLGRSVGAAFQRLIPAGSTIWIADAHRDDGKRFDALADEKLTAFLEVDLSFALAANWFDRLAGFLPDSASSGGQGRKLFSPSFLPLFQTCSRKGSNTREKRKITI